MHSKLRIVAYSTLAGLMSQAGWCASPSADAAEVALNQCVSMRTTGADRTLVARWLFAIMATSPQITDLSAVTAEHRKKLNQDFAALFTRLISDDCAAEVRPLAATGLEDAFGAVGKALGETAMTELMSGKEVDKALRAYTAFISEEDFTPFIESLPEKSK